MDIAVTKLEMSGSSKPFIMRKDDFLTLQSFTNLTLKKKSIK